MRPQHRPTAVVFDDCRRGSPRPGRRSGGSGRRLLDPAEALLNAGTSVGGGLLVLCSSLPTTR